MKHKEDFAHINGMLTHDEERSEIFCGESRQLGSMNVQEVTMRVSHSGYFRIVNISFTAPSLSTVV